MKIRLLDVSHRGYYFEELDFDLPNVKKLEDFTYGDLAEYVVEDLEHYIDFHESFMTEET